MITTPTFTDPSPRAPEYASFVDDRDAPRATRSKFRWSAALAGLAVAIAWNAFFAEIFLSLNLGIIDRGSSVGTIAIVNAIAWVLSGLISLYVGAWVAGHLSKARKRVDGSLHGLVVWAAGAVVMLLLAFTAAGVVGNGMMSLAGKGLEGAGKLATLAAPAWDGIKTELEGALRRSDAAGPTAAGQDAPTSDPSTRLLDRSRLFELAGRHFTIDGSEQDPAERAELVQLIAGQAGISKQVAERTLKQWDNVWTAGVERFDAAKKEAAKVADDGRRVAMAAAGWAAAAMLLGAIAALLGGAAGSTRRLEKVLVPVARR